MRVCIYVNGKGARVGGRCVGRREGARVGGKAKNKKGGGGVGVCSSPSVPLYVPSEKFLQIHHIAIIQYYVITVHASACYNQDGNALRLPALCLPNEGMGFPPFTERNSKISRGFIVYISTDALGYAVTTFDRL